jgi:hypothetical protein
MSGKNNVNPDHYKTAGRDRPNETLPPGNDGDVDMRARPDKRRAKRGKPAPNFIPGAAPVGEAPPAEGDNEETGR